jgi:hypothetical protein
MDHEGPQNKSIQIDEALVERKLGELVRETVEETLNKRLRRGSRRAMGGCPLRTQP